MSQPVRQGDRSHEDNTGSIITTLIVCMVLSGLSVVGRFTSRYLKKTSITISDGLIVGGLLGAWALTLIVIECEIDKPNPHDIGFDY